MLWSVSRVRSFRELLATGKEECRALVDLMVASAPRAQFPIAVSKIQAMKPEANVPASENIAQIFSSSTEVSKQTEQHTRETLLDFAF